LWVETWLWDDAKSLVDIDMQEPMVDLNPLDDLNPPDFDIDVDHVSKGKQFDFSSATSTQSRSHRRRSRASANEDATYKELSIQIGRIVLALERLTKNQLNFSDLYKEVMKIEGFDEIMLASAFDHLIQDKPLVRSFMLKNARLCRQ
jgi:hypothetical protein